jgi:uncharacterized repeat protein (TIGR03806 family)
MERRVPWTTSRIKGSPDPPTPYRTERVFPGLKFREPLALAFAREADRWFVAERYGKIYSFPNAADTERADLFLDLGRIVFGLALHPRFAENGYVYVSTIQDAASDAPRRLRVSRFVAHGAVRMRADPETERVILEWPAKYHEGGCLAFGPDGCLYIAAGDGGTDTGQELSDLPGSILRIDVGGTEDGREYVIPQDNPFRSVVDARAEIWAYGLRQPWKFSFDRSTGDLWAADVGQDLWEMVYRVQRGGNYGWNVTEGSHAYRPGATRGPTPILHPVAEHSHAEARSITGGFVYRGDRLTELVGTYVYGDYDTGKIWGLRYEDGNVIGPRELVDSTLRLVCFGEDAQDELLLLDHMGGGLHRLVANSRTPPLPPQQGARGIRKEGAAYEFPRKLSETGLFASVRDLSPAPGLIPYTVNAPLWSDGADKERYLAVPGDGQIEFDAITFPENAEGRGPFGWKFPDGTVLVKTFFLELETGNAASRRRLETRLLHHERLVGTEEVGDQYWRGYTYIWNDDQDDAVLLEDPKGLDRTFTIRDANNPGGWRQQTWHFPSRTECTLCHTMPAKFVLGVNTLQMNKEHDYDGVRDNQLRAWEHIGLFSKPLPAAPERLPGLVDYADETQDLDRRARSYLHANCSHCHRAFGGGNSTFQLVYGLGLGEMGIIGARPVHNRFNIADARIVTAGEPNRSLLFLHMAELGPGRMPPVASSLADHGALKLIGDWINQLAVAEDEASGAQ